MNGNSVRATQNSFKSRGDRVGLTPESGLAEGCHMVDIYTQTDHFKLLPNRPR
jgi:hypothetical protein